MRERGWVGLRGSGLFLVILILCLVAFALRVIFLDKQSLWGDEAYSLSLAIKASWGEILETVLAGDPYTPHTPLYYFLLMPWVRLVGSSDFALRWFSVAFGLLTVPACYALARRLVGVPAAGLVALLSALSPFLVYYSQEARMYAMAGFLAVLVLYFFLRALAVGGWGWWAAYLLSGLALVFTLNLGLVLVAALFFVALLPRAQARKGRLAALLPHVLIALSYLLWQGWQSSRFQMVLTPVPYQAIGLLGLDTLKDTLLAFTFGVTLDRAWAVDRVYAFRAEPLQTWTSVLQPYYTTLLAAGALALASLGAWKLARERRLAFATLVLSLAAVVASVFLLRLTTLGYAARLALIAAPLFLVFLAVGLVALPGVLRATALGLLLLGMGYALWQNYQNPVFSRSEYRVLAQYLAQEMEPGDGVYLHGPPLRLLHSHYLPQPHPVYSIPRSVPVPYNWEEVREQLQSLAQRRPRLWLVLGGESDYDPQRRVESWLLEHGYQVEDQWFGNSRLSLLVFPRGEGQQSFPGRPVGKDLVLVGSTVGQGEALTSGQGLPLTLTWRLLSPPEGDYRLSLRLTDGEGHLWAQRDMDLGAYLNPTSRWPVGPSVSTRTGLRLPPGTPSGDYFLTALVYDSSGQPLTGGNLGPVPVEVGPGPPVSAQRLRPPYRAGVPLGSLRVMGYDFPQKVRPGDKALLRLYWTAEDTPLENYALVIRLGSGTEQVFPLLPSYPTSRWRRGEALVSQHLVAVPAGAAGRLPISLGLAGPAGKGVLPLAQVEVADVRRSFQEPRVQRARRANLAGRVELMGLDLDPALPGEDAPRLAAGATLGVTLHWKALKEMDTSYTVFVQLLDGRGRLVAQEDALPQGGQRPTTGWLPGEVVSDAHRLRLPASLPPGSYILIAGMYDAASGIRLETVGGDFVPLMEVAVGNG